MTESHNKMVHRLTGTALVLIGLFVAISLVSIYSQTESIAVGGEIRNVAPETPTVYISSSENGGKNDYTTSTGVSLSASSTKTIYVNGTVVDKNGARDIDSIRATVYEASASGGASCSANHKDCYSVSCTSASVDATTIRYNCAVPMYYNAVPTAKWTASVEVTDSASANSSATESFKIDSLLSLNYSSELDFGTITPGTSTSATMTATQKGNVAAALRVAGSSLTCDSGDEISRSYIKYAATDVGYSSATEVPASAATVSGVEVARKTADATDTNDTITVYLYVPEGVSGSCSGTLEVSSSSAE